MSLRDLALTAGGVDEHAYLMEATATRIPEQGDPSVTTRSFRVALDSSYFFDTTGAAGNGKRRQPPSLRLRRTTTC